MKKVIFIFCASAFIGMIGCDNASTEKKEGTEMKKADSSMAKVDSPKKEEPMAMPDSATMMKAWQAYMTPGPMHKMMAACNGKWTTESTMWMDPNKPPMKSTGWCENKMALNGLYQMSSHHGNMMGMPFEGMGTTAYDNAKKMFVSTWVDNMGSGIMYMEGTYDSTAKTLNMKGKCVDPISGKDCDMRQTMKFVDDKHQMMEMFMTQGGHEMKTLELALTKK